MNVFCRSMALPSTGSSNAAMGSANISLEEGIDSDSALMKTKACFTLRKSLCAVSVSDPFLMTCQFLKKDYLVSDDAALCHLAFERGCLDHLSTLIHAISPVEPLQPEWEEGEPESLMALREVCIFPPFGIISGPKSFN
jgi:hypothetical protein